LALVVERLFKGRLKLPKNFLVHAIQVFLTFHFVVFCWIFFRAKDFPTAFDVIKNIGLVRFRPDEWLTILSGYRNVFLVMAIGYAWHFLPARVVDFLKSAFDRTPLVGKALVLAMTYWVVYATATSGPQPFIYFQF
jgi:hypothetical protein